MAPEIRQVITQDRSSGRYHIRIEVNGRRLVDERCNLDQAGAYDVVDVLPSDADRKVLCGWCFPDAGPIPPQPESP